MKTTKLQISLLLGALCLCIAMFIPACSSVPTKLELGLYDVQTNYGIPVINWRTNQVVVTNVVERVVTTTNVISATGAITLTMTPTREYTVTNFAMAVATTNIPVEYLYTVKTNTAASLQTASGIASLFNPAAGSLISVLGAGLLGLWGKLRSSRKISAGLAQGIEVAREVMWQLPNGDKLDASYKEWLKNHQRELGILTGVGQILETSVNVPAAQSVAEGIKLALEAATKDKTGT